MLDLINEQNDIYLYAKDLSKSKYEFLIKKRENAGIKHLNNPNAFIECSNSMDDIHDYNSSRRRKSLIVFDDIIADIMDNKKFQPIIKNCLLDAEIKYFNLLLLLDLISLFQKMSN